MRKRREIGDEGNGIWLGEEVEGEHGSSILGLFGDSGRGRGMKGDGVDGDGG